MATKLILVLALATSGCSGGKKAPECKALVNSMNELGAKLTVVRKVVGANEVNPTDVADSLKPFSITAKEVADSLSAQVPTISSLRKVAGSAASVALTLSKQSAQMAEFADQMRDVDAASKAVDENKKRVDTLEGQIKDICEAEAAKCVDLASVLARFPAPTDQNEVAEDAAAWTRKLSGWLTELAKVNVQDQELKSRVQAFMKGWQELGVAMTRVVSMLQLGRKFEVLTKDFNVQIEQANKAIANANALCAR